MTKRRHHRVQHTSTVTFRFASGAPRVLLVHGRPPEVRARVEANMTNRSKSMTFTDLHTNRTHVIPLGDVDTWSVK